MRLHQSWKNYVSQVLLEREVPVLSRLVRRWLVRVHVEEFVARSERDGDARRDHLAALFDAAIDVYCRALEIGYPEAEAREITHILASWDFGNHGWGELVEYPPDEREAYYRRYQAFYDRHRMSPGDPLGDFRPAGGLPDAPGTPERMAGDYPMAVAGLTDDVYVVREDWEVRLRCVAERQRAAREAAEPAPATAAGDD